MALGTCLSHPSTFLALPYSGGWMVAEGGCSSLCFAVAVATVVSLAAGTRASYSQHHCDPATCRYFFPCSKRAPPPLLSSSDQRPGGASEAAAEVQGSSHTEPEGWCCAFPLLGHLLNTSQSLLQSLCCSPSAPRQAQPCLTPSALGEREQQRVLIKAFSAVEDLHKPCCVTSLINDF